MTSTNIAIGFRQNVRDSDRPTVVLSVVRDGDITILTIGNITIYPIVERGAVRNVQDIRLSDEDVRLLVNALETV